MRAESQKEAQPVQQKNFISKWIDNFSNTVLVWIEGAGKLPLRHFLFN